MVPRTTTAFALTAISLLAAAQASEEDDFAGSAPSNSTGCWITHDVDPDGLYPVGEKLGNAMDEDSEGDLVLVVVGYAVLGLCICGVAAALYKQGRFTLTYAEVKCPTECWLLAGAVLGCGACLTCVAASMVLVDALSCGDCEEGDPCERGTPLCVCVDDVSAATAQTVLATNPVAVALVGGCALVALVAAAAIGRRRFARGNVPMDSAEHEPLANDEPADSADSAASKDEERPALSGVI